MKKLIISMVVVLAMTGGAASFVIANKEESRQAQQSAPTSPVQQAPQTEVSYNGVGGKNALELLKQSHKIETKRYEGLGELVTSIDGVAADSKHFWALYVNDQPSQVGAESYTSKGTDTITWKLEKIQ